VQIRPSECTSSLGPSPMGLVGQCRAGTRAGFVLTGSEGVCYFLLGNNESLNGAAVLRRESEITARGGGK